MLDRDHGKNMDTNILCSSLQNALWKFRHIPLKPRHDVIANVDDARSSPVLGLRVRRIGLGNCH